MEQLVCTVSKLVPKGRVQPSTLILLVPLPTAGDWPRCGLLVLAAGECFGARLGEARARGGVGMASSGVGRMLNAVTGYER